MSRVAVPLFVTGVALAATEASGVSVTQPLRGSTEPVTNSVTCPDGIKICSFKFKKATGQQDLTQQKGGFKDADKAFKMQFWDATSFYSANGICATLKDSVACKRNANEYCRWNDAAKTCEYQYKNQCITGTVGMTDTFSQNQKQVGPCDPYCGADAASPRAAAALPTVLSVPQDPETCQAAVGQQMSPAGAIWFMPSKSAPVSIGTGGGGWWSHLWTAPSSWTNPEDWWGGVQAVWEGNNCDSEPQQCRLSVQPSGGGISGCDKQFIQNLWICAATPSADAGQFEEFEVAYPQCQMVDKCGYKGASLLPPNGGWKKNKNNSFNFDLVFVSVLDV